MKHEINNAAVPIQKTSGQYPICDVVGGDFFAAGQVRSLVFIVHLSVSTLPYLVVAHSLSLYWSGTRTCIFVSSRPILHIDRATSGSCRTHSLAHQALMQGEQCECECECPNANAKPNASANANSGGNLCGTLVSPS